MTNLICKVCEKLYNTNIPDAILNLSIYKRTRNETEFCERCKKYHDMTGEYKDATESEFKNAEKAEWFAEMMSEWWQKDKNLTVIDNKESEFDKSKDWEGLINIAKWCRNFLNSN